MIKEIIKQMQNDYRFSYLGADIGTFTTTLYFKDNKFAIIHEGTTVTTYENIGGELFTKNYKIETPEKAKILLEHLYKKAMHKVYKTKEIPMYRAK